MSMTETLGSHGAIQRKLALEISARSALITLEAVRIARGCDAESVLNCVGDATHPKFLRWVFDLAIGKEIRNLRFWKDELTGDVEKWCEPSVTVSKILGDRQAFPRGEIEILFTTHSAPITRLVRAGELVEVNRQLTRASLAAFLERRLQ